MKIEKEMAGRHKRKSKNRKKKARLENKNSLQLKMIMDKKRKNFINICLVVWTNMHEENETEMNKVGIKEIVR